MEPKKLLSAETLEKKRNFTEKFGIILLPLNDKYLEKNVEEVKVKRPKI